ncbi:desmethylxanthohumol 6'-O-methyltransferase [Spinacia oleracea]|uniref:Desmethylxanthohumol 6'-O-methyltransferase n=1 Tax=Spinacia oleracea TaxID=3562 RepID=A0A9R0IDE0_SPIOL|nr:desmethylxanthohumol 6'-O-methyltransferase-like [Spinacia oleracea]
MGSNSVVLLENVNEDVDLLKSHAEVYNNLFAFADTLALRSAVELRIADIIHSHGQPMSLSQIASKLEAPSLDISYLARIMRLLVRKNIFTVDYNQGEGEEALYGLTNSSRWLIHDHDQSLAPMFLIFSHHLVVTAYYEIGRSIKEGGIPFVKAHGESFWNMASKDNEINNMFNTGMASATKPTLNAVIKGYKDGFSKLQGTVVDVGGGTGNLISMIVQQHPHIKGINFDLPHVVANAPPHPAVTHVAGDMFKDIPSAHNVIIKSVLHDWTDEDCLRILKKSQEAVFEKNGKIIIIDVVLHPDRHEMFDDASIGLDLLLMTNSDGGKERTEVEWKKLLNQAGFTRFNFIPLQAIMSFTIIEAFL